MFKVDNKLWTKVYVKPTFWQSYLHSKSEHPNSTKKSVAYGQALKFNKICYNSSDLHNNCKRLLNTLPKRSYNKTDTVTQINRAVSTPRNELLNKITVTGLYLTSNSFSWCKTSNCKILHWLLQSFSDNQQEKI